MLRDNLALYDGFQSIRGGMDSGTAPNDIGRSKVSFSRNVTFRGGFPRTRPAWVRRTLSFESATTQGRFEDNLFQGAYGFEPFNGGYKLAAAIGGRLFLIHVDDFYKTNELSQNLSPINSSTRQKAWLEQAEDFLIVQDGQSSPLVYDGASLRRVNATSIPKEVPVGTAMTYANGRLWVVKPQKKSFVAGDIVYGEAGTEKYNFRDAVLKFSENDFLNEGGEFASPFGAGEIRAIKPLANIDTSLGQGPVQVFAERGVFSVNAPFDRTQWKNLEYPLQTTSLLGSGSQSHEATVQVNGDLWFRSVDGIRSFQVARRDFNSWVNTPLSTEMKEVIDSDDKNLLEHASAILFDNRYLMTTAPYRVDGRGIVHRGLIALDFHNVSGIGARTSPVYDGLWTGLNILQIVPLKDRCFIFTLNASDKIQLWELTRDGEFDNGTTRIAAFIDTPSLNFGDTGWNRKELSTGDLWYDMLAGTVDFNVQFRPDQYPCYTAWHSWSVDSKRESCLTGNCPTPDSLAPQYRPRMRLPLPGDSCNAKVNMPFRQGFEFQCRIAWTGQARLKKFRLVAHQVQEDTLPFCEPSEATDSTGITCCDTSLYSYSSG